jgi:hypothetical protein
MYSSYHREGLALSLFFDSCGLCTNHMMTNQKHWAAGRSYLFITLFFVGAQHCCAFHQPCQHAQLCGAKTIFLSQNRHMLDFLHSILLCRITYWAPLEMLLARSKVIVKILKKIVQTSPHFLRKDFVKRCCGGFSQDWRICILQYLSNDLNNSLFFWQWAWQNLHRKKELRTY